MHILISARDLKTACSLKKNFRYENIGADTATLPENVFLKLFSATYDCLVIKEYQPGTQIPTLALKVRENYPQLPIVVLTPERQKAYLNALFQSGVSAFFSAPYPWENIITRIKTLISQKNLENYQTQTLKFRDLNLNLATRKVTRGQRIIALKNKEFTLLEFMLKNTNQILMRNTILEQVWDRNINILTNTIDVHINQLRRKIDDGFPKKLIHTVYCVGYKFGDK